MKSFATMLMVAVFASASFAQVTAPYFETFDTAGAGSGSNCTVAGIGILPAGWADGGGSSSWTVDGGGTTSSSTGPSDDVTGGGLYVYCETSGGCDSGEFLLESPMVDVSGLTNPAVGVRVNLNGVDIGALEIQETDGVGGWVTLDTIGNFNYGDTWYIVEYALTGTPMTQIRFRYTGAAGFGGDAAIDNVAFGEAGQVALPLPPVPPATGPEFQSNSAESSMGITAPDICVGEFTTVNWDSSLVGNIHDVLVNFGAPVGLSAGGTETPNLQTINVPLNLSSLVFLNQLLFGTFVPHPGTVSGNVFGGSPLEASAQQFVVNGAALDGYTLSAAIGLTVNAANPGPHAGPTGDDSTVLVTFNEAPTCTPLSIPFCGTVFTEVYINSNTNITFGGSDTDFSATVSEAISDDARFGPWTDLAPNQGGTITYSVDMVNGLTVNYNAFYYLETVAPDVTISVDPSGVATMDFSTFVANPLTATSSSDPMFLGLSSGILLGATDVGPAGFGIGSGSNAVGTDMLYEFADGATLATQTVPGQLDAITALQGGAGLLIFTPGANPGEYSWMGM